MKTVLLAPKGAARNPLEAALRTGLHLVTVREAVRNTRTHQPQNAAV